MARIFISYSRIDAEFARRLASDLDRLGANVWIDTDDIPAGMKWSTAIQFGLDLCEVMIVILSPESMASTNVEDEWQYFLDQGRTVIPVLWRPAKMHFQLHRLQYIDFHAQDYHAAFRELYAQLQRSDVSLAGLPLPIGRTALHERPVRRSFLVVGALLALIVIAAILLVESGALGKNQGDEDIVATRVILQMTQTAAALPLASETPVPTARPTSTPVIYFPAGTNNGTWQPVTGEFNRMTMVYVPAGCLMMGATDTQIDMTVDLCETYPDVYGGDYCYPTSYQEDGPAHEVCFEEFWISQTEVTNAQYKRCVDLGGCTPPLNTYFYNDPSYADHPVVYVGWDQATMYARWSGTYLPTEAQWEYAARGPAALFFPWGDDFDGTRLNYCDANCVYAWGDPEQDDGYRDTAPVGAFESGASWVGALDMSGNVWEWTADIEQNPVVYGSVAVAYVPSPPTPAVLEGDKRVVRGGAWDTDPLAARLILRASQDPTIRINDLGFRVCATDPLP